MFYFIFNYWREFIHNTPKNLNHVHKYSKDIMSVIVTLGPVVNGGENVLLNGITMDEIVKISNVINNSHVRCVLGAFEKFYMRSLFGLDTDMHYLLSNTNQYLFNF